MNSILNEGFNKMFKDLNSKPLTESTKRDDIDADADDKKELAKAKFMRKKDDADADKDYKLKKADMKEPSQLEAKKSEFTKMKESLKEKERAKLERELYKAISEVVKKYKENDVSLKDVQNALDMVAIRVRSDLF